MCVHVCVYMYACVCMCVCRYVGLSYVNVKFSLRCDSGCEQQVEDMQSKLGNQKGDLASVSALLDAAVEDLRQYQIKARELLQVRCDRVHTCTYVYMPQLDTSCFISDVVTAM
jgi:hypothetical protein